MIKTLGIYKKNQRYRNKKNKTDQACKQSDPTM